MEVSLDSQSVEGLAMGADCSPPSRQARGPRTTGGRQPGLMEGIAFDALLGDKDGRTADSSLFGRWWSSAFRLTTPIFVARGPALLFGISRSLSQHGISRKRRNNLIRVLIAVERSTQESKRTRLIHRPARDIVALDCRSDSLAFVAQIVGAISLVQRNSVPSLHMRRIITASRRASATMAFFCPRRLAMFIAHAFSHDHFCTRVSMTCAAS